MNDEYMCMRKVQQRTVTGVLDLEEVGLAHRNVVALPYVITRYLLEPRG